MGEGVFPLARKANPEPLVTVSTIGRCSRITHPRKKTGTPPTTSPSGPSIFSRNTRTRTETLFSIAFSKRTPLPTPLLPFLPHDPLHAWPEDIAKYEGVYEKGYEAIRNARFKRQKEMGLFGPEAILTKQSFLTNLGTVSLPKEKDWYTTDYFTKWAIDFLRRKIRHAECRSMPP